MPELSPTKLPRRRFAAALTGLVAVLAIASAPLNSRAGEAVVKIPALVGDTAAGASAGPETAVFAGGCFWGVQGVFQHTRGVLSAVSGYAGGSQATAHYDLVGSGLTGHAESVQVRFDPKQVSYAQLLQIFFSVAHDPTQLNRQGPDRGTQYRSALFTLDATQQQTAQRYIAQLDAAKVYPAKIVTQVAPLAAFYPAEDYHQDYATLHPESGYIATFDLPKIAALKNLFAAQYRADPVLVAGA
ncbi:MAG TPA: peptide-methionine (S)-S-oxide reductase MsrA, partial [Burkholderiaceae bacterium]|nr:peptide-methionine (S)-S-oxide reductase MsrA [Burkholderiaceae bacterium]